MWLIECGLFCVVHRVNKFNGTMQIAGGAMNVLTNLSGSNMISAIDNKGTCCTAESGIMAKDTLTDTSTNTSANVQLTV